MSSQQFEIGVASWSTWLPAGDAALCSTFRDAGLRREVLDKPALASVPALQRRRLGPLARVVFQVLGECMGEIVDEPVIFSSRMGEIQRTQGILEAIAAQEQVSPAAFSLAVHNGIAGLWSLVHGVHAPLLALAPGDCSPVPALLEALGHLAERPGECVSVVCYEEALPAFYQPYLDGPPQPVAVALRLCAPAQARQVLTLGQLEPAASAGGAHFQSLIDLLHRDVRSVVLDERQCRWQLGFAA